MWSRPPPPSPPPPPPPATLPVVASVLVCWVLPFFLMRLVERRERAALASTSAALRRQLCAAVRDIATRSLPGDRCLILSGGVDTCAILAAAEEVGVSFAAGITVLTGDDSPDKEFAVAAATAHGLAHHVVFVTASDLVQTYLPQCADSLHTFDGMTLRNSLVVAAAFRKARELGFKHAVVGDGADELFGGYSFMWGCGDDLPQWRRKRDAMCAEWTFATAALAEMHGLRADGPFLEPGFVRWALASTGRPECIGSRPIQLALGGPKVEQATGKVALREAFATVASWRRKDPIEVGSGITVIGHDPFWAELISDEEYRAEAAALASRGYVIKNKEHLANFRAFEAALGRDGARHPTRKRLPVGQGCAGCCFDVGSALFCDVCGAYPATRS